MSARDRDLSPTALYTASLWAWAGCPDAELFEHAGTRAAFAVTAAALRVGLISGAPSTLREALVQRHAVIDRVVDDAGVPHVLELAAGLSQRGAHRSRADEVQYVEVDVPAVIARKRSLLLRTAAGRDVLARLNLRLVAADLTAIDLATVSPAPPATPLTVIAEGLLMYLDAEAQRRLFARVRALLGGGGVFVFDLVPMGEQLRPDASARLLRWLVRRSTGGSDFVRDHRTRREVAADLRAAGFEVTLLEPAATPARWAIPHRDLATLQLTFVARVPSGARTFVADDVIAADRPEPRVDSVP